MYPKLDSFQRLGFPSEPGGFDGSNILKWSSQLPCFILHGELGPAESGGNACRRRALFNKGQEKAYLAGCPAPSGNPCHERCLSRRFAVDLLRGA
jgi:hypothetical protein